MKKALIHVCVIAASIACFASDKALLEMLAAKGTISQDEAHAALKLSSHLSAPSHNSGVQSLKICGAVQTQYHYLNVEDSLFAASKTSNGFQLRRVFLGVYADLGSDMMAVIDLDLRAGVIENAPYLNAAFFSKKFANNYLAGTAYLGYLKVNFAIEEYTSATRLISLDRSMVTRYFTIEQRAGSGNVGFGSAYTGLFWNGRSTHIKGLGYGVAVTNSQNYTISPQTSPNYGGSANIWTDTYYESKTELLGAELQWRAGVNLGYGNQANSSLNAPNSNCGDIWGANPYVKIKWDSLVIWSEFIAAGIENGRAKGTQYATPIGVNAWIEYTFNLGEWGRAGPVFRYSYLNTDGRGARISDCLPGVANIDASGDTALNLYDTAQSVSVGANWYLLGHNLKIQAAYEWAQFNGAVAHSTVSSKRADANMFRLQVQVMF